MHHQLIKRALKYHPDSEVAEPGSEYIDNFRSRAHFELLHVAPLEKNLIDGSIMLPGRRTNLAFFRSSPPPSPLNAEGLYIQTRFPQTIISQV